MTSTITADQAQQVRTEAVRGPWYAIVVDEFGDLLDRTDLPEMDADDEVEVRVVRGTAVPVDGDVPPRYCTSDVAFRETAYIEDDDPTLSAAAWLARAEAMARGLNDAEGVPFDAGSGPVPGYYAGRCGHRVAISEWRAGCRTCERCPATAGA